MNTPLRSAPSEILIPPGPSIVYVALDKGLFARIDVDDIPLIEDKNWHAVKDPKSGRVYPATHLLADGVDESVSMRTMVLRAKPTISYALSGNNLDCRKANLRDVSKAQSSWRNGKRSDNKTGHTGVFWSKEKQRFIAKMITNGVEQYIGSFRTVEEAAEAVNQAEVRLRGEFARRNSPMLTQNAD